MQVLNRADGALHYRIDGPDGAPVVIFANSLGTDLRLWDALLPLLPQGLRYLRYDKQGHGLSDLWQADRLQDHADDAIALIRDVAQGPVVFVGLSIGGLIGQRVASQHPDLVRALVLSNTAARLGTPDSWQDRIAAIRRDGLPAMADGIMQRWFGPDFRATPQVAPWRNMLARTAPEAYVAACHALAGADQTQATAALDLPTAVIAGSADGASPPDLVAATAALIRDASFDIISGAGHLPCVETPAAHAAIIAPFLERHAR